MRKLWKKTLLVTFLCMIFSLTATGNVFAADSKKTVDKDDAESITVARTADIVFVIDTTGSMGGPIRKVRENILKFFDKISDEKVDVRIRLVSFRDIAEDSYTDAVKTYPASGWYDRTTIEDAKEQLSKELFIPSGGGDYAESALVPLADILRHKDTYFLKDGKETTAKFCVLITDATYKNHTHLYKTDSYSGTVLADIGDSAYIDTFEGKTAAETAGKKGIIEDFKEQGINMSVITRNSLFSEYAKFVTESTTLSANDGGMIADINDNFDILFEKLAERITDITDTKYKEIVSKKTGYKPIKVRANMIVLKKQTGCTYSIAASGSAVSTPAWSAKQSSCVFKNLSPSSIYAFRVYSSGGGIIDEYELETESTTGARFKDIPQVVYEGEVYNIKPDVDITRMMATSGASIEWNCNTDCVSIKKDKVGNGCQMSVKDCQFNENKRIKAVLEANVTYSIKGTKGEYKTKTRKLKKKFEIENTVDAIEVGSFLGTSENVYKDGVILLGTTESVSLDMILNQGEDADTASRQRMAYYISDRWGVKNPNGKKIAKVDSRGKITGVNAGVTYVTIAPQHTYNKYGRCYDFMATIPVVCQPVMSVEFDHDALLAEDPNILKWVDDEATNDVVDYVISGYIGDSFDIKKYLKYNPVNAFNQTAMKQAWVSSDRTVATVNSKGIVRCKGPGYVTITMTPVGGLEISAATGRRDVNAKPCSASIVVKVAEKESETGI